MGEDVTKYKFGDDEWIVSLLEYNSYLLLATNKSLYRLNEKKAQLEKVKIQIEVDNSK